MTTQTIILQAGGGISLLPMLLIMVVFFIFMIWPQMRKAKKAKVFNQGLQKGNKVITTGGFHGKITSVSDSHFIIDLEEGSMKIEKSAVSMDMTAAAYGSQNGEAVATK